MARIAEEEITMPVWLAWVCVFGGFAATVALFCCKRSGQVRDEAERLADEARKRQERDRLARDPRWWSA